MAVQKVQQKSAAVFCYQGESRIVIFKLQSDVQSIFDKVKNAFGIAQDTLLQFSMKGNDCYFTFAENDDHYSFGQLVQKLY